MTRKLILAALFLFAAKSEMLAQAPMCGTDLLRNHYAMAQPELLKRESDANQQIFQRLISGSGTQQGVTYIIPVVFHIMHDNGPENVPDSVITNAVDELNLRYQNAPAYYDSTGHPVNIQFCLASVDPQGNPTTGITRYATNYTYFTFPNDDQSLKNLDRWSPDLYYNVWVVFNISGFIDGYASFPFYAGQSIDGVVIEYLYITNSYLLAHETAHYCGLYHTFQDGCNNFNCQLNGDQVCDTPPDNSSTGFPCMSNSCQTEMQDTSGANPFTGDVNELPNYMDYTTCPLSFTQGQCDRMENSVSLLRSNLFISNGCGNFPGQAPPIANFNYEISNCNTGIVTFSDSTSLNALTSDWDLDNNGTYDTIAHNFSYTFPATGIYTVQQRVTGTGGQDIIAHTFSVHKGATFNYPIINYPQAVTDTIRICAGDSITLEADSNGVTYLWSTGDTTSTLTLTPDSSMQVTLIMTDTTGFTWNSQCAPVNILVYPFNSPDISYDDTLGYTCYGSILHLYITNPIQGVYTWQVYNVSNGWFNTLDHNLYYDYSADPFNGSYFFVTYTNPAGCSANSDTVFVQPHLLPFFTGTPLTVYGDTLVYPVGNFQYQWYNNNTPIPGATTNQYIVTSTGCYNLAAWDAQYPGCIAYTDTVCFLFSGIGEINNEIIIRPNPATEFIQINLPDNWGPGTQLEILNVEGRKVVGETILQRKAELNTSDMPPGVYIIRIYNTEKEFRKKVIIGNH